MEFTAYAVLYCSERDGSALYHNRLKATAAKLTKFSGGSLPLECLSSEGVNRWLIAITGTVKDITVANKRRQVRTLWTAAHDAGLAPPVGKLRRIKVVPPIPRAWTLDQLSLLLAAADRQEHRKQFFRSLFLAYFDTGLRIGDLVSIERQWIWPGGFISLSQHKTSRAHRVGLRPATMEAIEALLIGRTTGPIWALWCCRRHFFRTLRKIIDDAGLPGSSRWIRRASASYVERDHPGMGWRHLGHAKPGLAEVSYLDPNIVAHDVTMPPAIR